MLNKKRFLVDASTTAKNLLINTYSNFDVFHNDNINFNHINYNLNDITKDNNEKVYPKLFEDISSIKYSFDKSQEGTKHYNSGFINNNNSNNISFIIENNNYLEKKEKYGLKFCINNNTKDKNNKNCKYFCSYCFKKFTQPGSRNRHEYKRHSNYKGDICNFCGKSYLNLLQHKSRCPNNMKNKDTILNEKKLSNNDDKCISLNINSQIIIFNSYDEHKKNLNKYVPKLIKKYLYYPDLVIGKGSSMSVYFGKIKETEKEIAIKIDNNKNKYGPNKFEKLILKKLSGNNGFNEILDYLSINGHNATVQPLLGPSLKKLLVFCNGKFDFGTVCHIGIEILNRLELLHDNDILHNDIKPSNLAWGRYSNGLIENKETIYLTDFGLSRRYAFNIESLDNCAKNNHNNNKYHYYNEKENLFQGTPLYMGEQVLNGYRPSRKSDLESFIYSLLYMLHGEPIWAEEIRNKKKSFKEIKKIRKNEEIDQLFKDFPYQFKHLYLEIKNLKFDSRPNYSLYRELLLDSIGQKNGVLEHKYCWEIKINELNKKFKDENINVYNHNQIKLLFNNYY
jgi:serine/threonine protein kinase